MSLRNIATNVGGEKRLVSRVERYCGSEIQTVLEDSGGGKEGCMYVWKTGGFLYAEG